MNNQDSHSHCGTNGEQVRSPPGGTVITNGLLHLTRRRRDRPVAWARRINPPGLDSYFVTHDLDGKTLARIPTPLKLQSRRPSILAITLIKLEFVASTPNASPTIRLAAKVHQSHFYRVVPSSPNFPAQTTL
jgi:hypothetical protein